MKKIAWIAAIIDAVTRFVKAAGANWKTVVIAISTLGSGIFVSQMWFKSKASNNAVIESSLKSCETDRTTMLQAIMKWQGELSSENGHSFVPMNNNFVPASYIIFDTIPLKQLKVVREMDSLLRKMKADSIKRSKQS